MCWGSSCAPRRTPTTWSATRGRATCWSASASTRASSACACSAVGTRPSTSSWWPSTRASGRGSRAGRPVTGPRRPSTRSAGRPSRAWRWWRAWCAGSRVACRRCASRMTSRSRRRAFTSRRPEAWKPRAWRRATPCKCWMTMGAASGSCCGRRRRPTTSRAMRGRPRLSSPLRPTGKRCRVCPSATATTRPRTSSACATGRRSCGACRRLRPRSGRRSTSRRAASKACRARPRRVGPWPRGCARRSRPVRSPAMARQPGRRRRATGARGGGMSRWCSSCSGR